MGPNFARDITWERLILLIKNDRKIRFVKRSFQGRYNLLLGGNAPQNSVNNFFLRIFWSDGVADVDLQLSPPSLFFLLKGWSLFSIHMYMCFEFLCSVIYALWSSKSRNCWFTDGLCVKFDIYCDYTHQQIWFELHTAMTAKKTYLDNRFRLRRSSDPLKGDSK